MADVYDAFVCGAGPAGASASLVLARSGWRVLMVDGGAAPPFPKGESLPPAAFPLLRDLGLIQRIRESHLPCPGNVAVWGSCDAVTTDFIRDPNGHGWHLDRARFDNDLRAEAEAAGAVFRPSAQLLKWTREQKVWSLQMRQETTADIHLTAHWLLDATGRRGRIAASHGFPAQRRDRLVAYVVALPAAHDDQDARSWIEAVEDGWWYSALVPGRRRVVAYFTDAVSPTVPILRWSQGLQQINMRTTHLRHRIAWPIEAIRVRCLPAHSATRGAFAGPGWLAVGDATLAFDPISSQGLFHALYTGIRGAESVIAAHRGDDGALPTYESRIRTIEAAYRDQYRAYYQAEQRWPNSPFWKRRI